VTEPKKVQVPPSGVDNTGGGVGGFVRRSWKNWEGRYRNRLTGIARAGLYLGILKKLVEKKEKKTNLKCIA
jgi:hypothetical protein